MPTDSENIHFLYLILTHGGAPNVRLTLTPISSHSQLPCLHNSHSIHQTNLSKINWAAVATAMDLKSGAVSKRWYRLKQSMDKGETPAASNYPFLWLCVKHDKREHVSVIFTCTATFFILPHLTSLHFTSLQHPS